MIHIRIPETTPRRLSFYLAAEEYVARCLNDADDCFFMWQVEPTVIFGRNQDIETEVNLEYCRKHNIQLFRRRSGGGCVYADRSNLMMSYITRDEQVSMTFSRYMTMVTSMLAELGLQATSTQHNDVLIGGRKVSGNAFYHIPGHSIVHGTMLFDTDMEHMLNAITPTKEKLDSHGVKSVRQRITLLREHTSLTIDQFRQHAISRLCRSERVLTGENLQRIEHIELRYLNPQFIFGKEYNANIPGCPKD
ncbi:MAG: lipoate--protein ligase family protein [Bacteroidaceae bacterium]|nr:lipoate--protein ligase family protein [Bacteroidaceae bacterium]